MPNGDRHLSFWEEICLIKYYIRQPALLAFTGGFILGVVVVILLLL